VPLPFRAARPEPFSRRCVDQRQQRRRALLLLVDAVMAGTSDLPVGREAAPTLAFAGQRYREYTDVGVAGLWCLLERIGDIRSSPVVIVAAGMDAALVSVVGGLVSSAVIALPTSVGYGVALGGATALHAALASCAPGISVVNIDNGYGAACAALRISLALVASQNAAEHLE
jgi:pyridinium-3,5-biscarboxylic acid mononucleotide synthase